MKKITLLLITFAAVVFTSCDNKKDLIVDYIQSNFIGEDVKVDLSTKVKKLEFVKDITGKDLYDNSLPSFDSIIKVEILYLEYKIESRQTDLEFHDEWLRLFNEERFSKEEINTFNREIDSCSKLLKEINNNNFTNANEYLKTKADTMNDWKTNPDKVYERIYNCTYTFINPLLNSAKVEISKSFNFNADETKVLSDTHYITENN